MGYAGLRENEMTLGVPKTPPQQARKTKTADSTPKKPKGEKKA